MNFKIQNMHGFHFILRSKLFKMENHGDSYIQPSQSWYRKGVTVQPAKNIISRNLNMYLFNISRPYML
jgi:hypothetical protein